MLTELTGLGNWSGEQLDWVSPPGRKTKVAPQPLPRQTLTLYSPSTRHHQVDSHFVGHQDPQQLLVHSRLKTGMKTGGSIRFCVFLKQGGGGGGGNLFSPSVPSCAPFLTGLPCSNLSYSWKSHFCSLHPVLPCHPLLKNQHL